MNVSDFDFELPDELIAQRPPTTRGESRLLVVHRDDGLEHMAFKELGRYLTPGDLLVANATRVFPARLLGRRVPSGGAVECLLLSHEPSMLARDLPSDQPQPKASPKAEAQRAKAEGGSHANGVGQIWTALMHPGQKLKPGALARFEGAEGVLMAEVLARQYFGRRRIRLWVERGPGIDALVDAMGH